MQYLIVFCANKGVPVRYVTRQNNPNQISVLCDEYGLDIRRLAYRKWVLAGEWFGDVYVDYIADRINEHKNPPGSVRANDIFTDWTQRPHM